MAQDHGIKFIPHGWNTALGVAADLHLSSAFPGTDLIEYKTGSAYVDEIVVGGWKLDSEGMLAIPDKPGLTAVELFDAVRDGRVKAVWIACTNPAQSMPDLANVRAALEAAELVVLQEAYTDTETAPFADVPVSKTLEDLRQLHEEIMPKVLAA
jgi:anaerobic selenocysteine-containing dehydrogenase